jgi:hypothetical protein
MINQEDIFGYILNEEWSKILDILYKNKNEIKNDTLLQSASKTFETEFLKKVNTYDISQKEILENLETLNILHFGNFFKLSDESLKTLTIELVKRKPLKEAYEYAKKYPNEEICKKIIKDYENNLEKNKVVKQKTNLNWIEIFNRTFELINNVDDAETYFSGPRFIKIIKEFKPYFPDYKQYIQKRNNEGKSTSRKIFYYDILMELDEDERLKILKRILEITKHQEKDKVEKIENLINGKNTNNTEISIDKTKPTVFISYSWDSEEHKLWVLKLAERLTKDGINVILDRYYLKPGKNLPYFVENSIEKSDRIIIVFTENYKLKADKRKGGVGYEYSILNADLYNKQTDNEKIIPLLRNGNKEKSIPKFMQQFIHIDIRNDENFENSYNDLVREIYNEPEIIKPQIGEKPNFKNS